MRLYRPHLWRSRLFIFCSENAKSQFAGASLTWALSDAPPQGG
jgi:hypothetical protein